MRRPYGNANTNEHTNTNEYTKAKINEHANVDEHTKAKINEHANVDEYAKARADEHANVDEYAKARADEHAKASISTTPTHSMRRDACRYAGATVRIRQWVSILFRRARRCSGRALSAFSQRPG